MAAAVVTVVILGAGGIRAHTAPPAGPKVAVLTTQREATRAPTPRSTTTVAQLRVTPSTRPPASTTTAVPPVSQRASTTTRPHTTTTVPASPRPSRKTCLALAAANHYRVVVANETWLQQQLRALAAQHLLGGPKYKALLIEEAQAETEIAAQYTIDRSNCYLG